jgi:hypothetical protein
MSEKQSGRREHDKPAESAKAQEVWDDESPAQGQRLVSEERPHPPGTTDDPDTGPDAWVSTGD